MTQQVIPAFPVRTYQATIAQLTSPLSMPAQRPKGAVPGRGGIEVTLRAKLGDGLDGVREYMSGYLQLLRAAGLARHGAARPRAMGCAHGTTARVPGPRWADQVLPHRLDRG
ncbi:MAG: hypothetical protein U1F35_17705 [Steroidobacteraceae bacterium]